MSDIIKILVVDDHEVVRKGYAFMLQTFTYLDLVGEASSGEQALELCEVLKPDVVLMDIHLPKMSGIEAIERIVSKYTEINIIAITSFEDEIMLVKESLEAGAKGFIYKDTSIDELALAIRQVNANKMYLSSDATQNLVHTKLNIGVNIDLTIREQEILEKLAGGLTNKQIAEHCQLSPNTVKFHVRNLLNKLGASTRTEAVSLARQYQLVK